MQFAIKTFAALCAALTLAAQPAQIAPVYVPLFQQTGDAGAPADIGAFLTYSVRLRLQQIPGIREIEQGSPCDAAPQGPEQRAGSSAGGTPPAVTRNPSGEKGGAGGKGGLEVAQTTAAAVPTGRYYVVRGSIDVRGVENGPRANVVVSYTILSREGCATAGQSPVNETYQFVLGDLLDGFSAIGDKISSLVRRAAQPHRTIVDIEEVKIVNGAAANGSRTADLLSRYLAVQLSARDIDTRTTKPANAPAADYTLRPELVFAPAKGEDSVTARVAVFAPSGPVGLPQPLERRAKKSDDPTGLAFDLASATAKQIDTLRAAQASAGVAASDIQGLLSAARKFLCRDPQAPAAPCPLLPKEALAALNKINPRDAGTGIDKAELTGQANVALGNPKTAAAAFDLGVSLTQPGETARRPALLRQAGDSYYFDSNYTDAADRYRQYFDIEYAALPAQRDSLFILNAAFVKWSNSLQWSGHPLDAIDAQVSSRTRLGRDPGPEIVTILSGLNAADLTRALDLLRAKAGPRDPLTAQAMRFLGERAEDARDFTHARSWYEQAAALGNADSMYDLGVAYEYGRGVPKNEKTALDWYTRASDGGNAYAATNLAILYADGRGTSQNYLKARVLFASAADRGDFRAMTWLGFLNEKGFGIGDGKPDYSAARSWYEKAAVGNEPWGMDALGYLFEIGKVGTAPDPAAARRFYQRAATFGSTAGMLDLGRAFQKGIGGPIDLANAKLWFTKALNAGDTGANLSLGLLAEDQKDFVLARQWYEKCASIERGCMTNLGLIYDDGKGVAQNYAVARGWYEKAIALKDEVATRLLGYMYETGRGMDIDLNRARQLYESAADLNDAHAMELLGRMHQYGKGFPADRAAATAWYEKAANAGDPDAFLDLGQIAEDAKDYAAARAWYQKGADRGFADSMAALGLLLDTGKVSAPDYPAARALYEKAAELANPSAVRLLGFMYGHGNGVDQDYTKARQLYEKAAALNDAHAMELLGTVYQLGQGVPVDIPAAKTWFQKAADAGDPDACTDLGDLAMQDKDYATARQWYQKGADRGNDSSMAGLGYLYDDGKGVDRNYATARAWYEKAASLGNGSASRLLGYLYSHGNGVTKDAAKARELYEKAAALNDGHAMELLGLMYQNGDGVTANPAAAKTWFQKAVDAGDPDACSDLGMLAEQEADYVTARQAYEKGVERGDTDSMTDLGLMYQEGKGVKPDYTKARELYKKAAGQNNASALRLLGYLYGHGQGVKQDYVKARELYEKAAALNDAHAMDLLGALHEQGQGTPVDRVEARSWYRKSAEAGDVDGMTDLGALLENGQAGPPDYAAARGWYEKAIAADSEVAMRLLGQMYELAHGTRRDYAQARQWYEKAAQLNDARAMYLLGALYEKGSGVSKNAAQARTWYEKAAAAGDSDAKAKLR